VELKNTPTPWHVENNPGDWGLPGVIEIWGDGKMVCNIEYTTPCMGASRSDIEEYARAQSDAALIVNAVNNHAALVEALKAARHALRSYQYGNSDAGVTP